MLVFVAWEPVGLVSSMLYLRQDEILLMQKLLRPLGEPESWDAYEAAMALFQVKKEAIPVVVLKTWLRLVFDYCSILYVKVG